MAGFVFGEVRSRSLASSVTERWLPLRVPFGPLVVATTRAARISSRLRPMDAIFIGSSWIRMADFDDPGMSTNTAPGIWDRVSATRFVASSITFGRGMVSDALTIEIAVGRAGLTLW